MVNQWADTDKGHEVDIWTIQETPICVGGGEIFFEKKRHSVYWIGWFQVWKWGDFLVNKGYQVITFWAHCSRFFEFIGSGILTSTAVDPPINKIFVVRKFCTLMTWSITEMHFLSNRKTKQAHRTVYIKLSRSSVEKYWTTFAWKSVNDQASRFPWWSLKFFQLPVYLDHTTKLRDTEVDEKVLLTIGIASNANTATPKKRGTTDHPANFGNSNGFPALGIK